MDKNVCKMFPVTIVHSPLLCLVGQLWVVILLITGVSVVIIVICFISIFQHQTGIDQSFYPFSVNMVFNQ